MNKFIFKKTFHTKASSLQILVLSTIFALSGCMQTTSKSSNSASAGVAFSGISSTSNLTCSTVQLNWASVSNAAFYTLFDTSTTPATYLLTIKAPATSYVVGNLSPGKIYHFQVHVTDLNYLSDQTQTDVSVEMPSTDYCQYFSTVMADRPILYWRMGDAVGSTTVLDSSGNNYHGIPVGGVTFGLAGPLQKDNNTGIALDGTGFIGIPSDLSFPVNTAVSVEFWNFVTTADVRASTTINIGSFSSPDAFSVTSPTSDKRLYWDYGTTSTGRVFVDYTPYLDRWAHITLVSKGKDGNFKAIYIDGVQVASGTASDGPTKVVSGGAVGNLNSNFFKGKISDLSIYNYVLSPTQIQNHHKAAGY